MKRVSPVLFGAVLFLGEDITNICTTMNEMARLELDSYTFIPVSFIKIFSDWGKKETKLKA